MRLFLARCFLAAIAVSWGASTASAAVVALKDNYADKAREVIADLDYFARRFSEFAEGATEPLFHGRSLPVPAETCTTTDAPRRFGLLIGAADPAQDTLKLKGPDNDVQLLATVLASVGANRDDIHALTGETAKRAGIVEAAWEILSSLECGDKVFVYFGGHALSQDDVMEAVAGPDRLSPSGATLDVALRNARAFVTQPKIYAAVPDQSLSIRRTLDKIDWYMGSGLTFLLNGEGVIGRDPPTATSFEILTSADLSELVTLLRNHRADVTVVLDTNHASDAAMLPRQQAVSQNFWTSDILAIPEEGIYEFASRILATRLVPSPGELAVFYSSVGEGISVDTRFDVGGEQIIYGLFTFRLAEAMLHSPNATVRDVGGALERIARASDRRGLHVHRVEATRPDMRVFQHAEGGRQRTDTIRIIQPSGMRGASVLETPQFELVGIVDWRAPTKAVLVEGQPASITRDGRFSASVKLNAGLNTISVTALTSDDEIHVMPPLEIMFDGDLKKLKGDGQRYALIIANQNYRPETKFSTLATPVADAESLRNVLVTRYGFSTELPMGDGDPMTLFLVDATKDQIEETLYTLSQVAGEHDTVLVYYAGHGVYDERTTNAYWVPVDATRPFNYLSGVTLTEHIQRMVARSVILISDSCYAGALRSGGDSEAAVAAPTDEDRQRALLRMADQRSRILITSGGTEPVLDTGGDGHSVFARALLTGLTQMQGEAFAAEELFRQYIRPMVSGRVEQMPQFRPIERTGHEPSADVVFVRTGA